MAMSGDVSLYQPPLSLWHLVELNVSPEQQEEIRSMLGGSLIETSLDLHNEVKTLLEIWQEYQEETQEDQTKTYTLAEPPHIRERLIKEICFLAEGVREKLLRKGMSPLDLFSGHNTQILDYAEEAWRSGSSMGRHNAISVQSTDGQQTPISPSDKARSRLVLSDMIQDNVTSAADKLNYMQFDQVCSELRDTLRKEVEQLEADVLFLNSCLDQAADVRMHAASPPLSREPTLTELREERSLLEKALLSKGSLPRTPAPAIKPSFLAKHPGPTCKMQNLTPVNTRLRPAALTTPLKAVDRGTHKTGPVRACHPAPPSPDQTCTSSFPDSSITTSPGGTISEPETSSKPGDRFQPESSSMIGTSPMPGSRSVAGYSINKVTAQAYDLNFKHITVPDPMQPSRRESSGGGVPRENSIRKREGSGNQGRTLNPSIIKVMPVGRIIPTHPSAEKPQLPRPSSAERFRKMVMHSRETT